MSPANATLLMLSASVSNAEDVAGWIESVRGKPVRIVQETHRPVELRLGFLHPELGVVPLEDTEGNILPQVESWYRGGAGDDRGRGGRHRSSHGGHDNRGGEGNNKSRRRRRRS